MVCSGITARTDAFVSSELDEVLSPRQSRQVLALPFRPLEDDNVGVAAVGKAQSALLCVIDCREARPGVAIVNANAETDRRWSYGARHCNGLLVIVSEHSGGGTL